MTDLVKRASDGEAAARGAAPRVGVLKRASWSVRWRLVLVMLATTAAALVVASGAMMYQDMVLYERTLRNDMTTQAELIARATAAALTFDDAEGAMDSLAVLRARPSVRAAALYTAKGRVFATYVRDPGTRNTEIPATPDSEGLRIVGNSVVLFQRVVGDNEILGTIYLKAEYELGRHVRSYLAIIGVVLLAALALALAIAWWLQRTVTRPILAMRDAARAVVEKRDFSQRVEKTTEDEIGYLAEAFNRMLAEISQRTTELERSNEQLEQQVRERESAEAGRRHAQEALQQLNTELEQRVTDRTEQLAAANKELESFSYSVSHDLRAPVRAILGFSKLLAEHHEAQLDDEAKRKLGIVRSEAARMGTLIDDLLAFSRLGRQALQMRSLHMEELVRLTFENIKAHHEGPVPELRLGKLPAATGDRTLIAQVWMNLLSNAFKFSSKKPDPRIEVDSISDRHAHTYFVRDNGAGFDPRYASKLFGVFQRLHDSEDFPGTGVGLALVQRIVVRHGGRVWAEGRPGEGATFYFTLPRSENDGAV